MRRTREEAQQTRENVLRAAGQVIAQQGVNAFTIEAVAQEAGLTKGGVLHHFPSKESLINDLIERVIETFNVRLLAELDAEPAGVGGRWLRAYIRTIFLAEYDEKSLIPALAAAAGAGDGMLERIRQGFMLSQMAAAGDGLDATRATIIRLAVEGLVFTRALGVDVLDKETTEHVYESLLRLTQPQE